MSLSAQNKPETYTGWDNMEFYTEVYCDGVVLGTVTGNLDVHYVWKLDRYGNWSVIFQAKGIAAGDWTEETFTYKELDKADYGEGTYSWIYHLKGNMGSKFMGHVTWNMLTGEIIVGPATCK
jgi:hypothetical protein